MNGFSLLMVGIEVVVVGSQFVAVMDMKSVVICDVTLYSPVEVVQHFGGTSHPPSVPRSKPSMG
jgi:hypothetical protein